MFHPRPCHAPSFLWIFCLFLAIYLATMGGEFFVSDGEVMFETTEGLVERGSIALPASDVFTQIVPGRDGHFYSQYGLGQPVAAVPFYLAGRLPQALIPSAAEGSLTRLAVSFFNQFVTAATCGVLYLFAASLFRCRRTALALTIVYGLGTLAWPYAKFFFSEPLLALCLLSAAYLLHRFRSHPRPLTLTIAGVALGFAVFTKVSAIVLLPAFLVYYGYTDHCQQRRGPSGSVAQAPRSPNAGRACWYAPRTLLRHAPLLAPLTVFAGLVLLHNLIRFGSPLNNAYTGESFWTPLYLGLYGLLFSTGKGLLFYSPAVLALPLALAPFARRHAAEAALFLALVCGTLLYYAGWWAWYGGWSWGPRFLVPIIPFLVLPLGALPWARRSVRVLLVALLVASVMVQVLGVTVDFNRYVASTYETARARQLTWIKDPQPGDSTIERQNRERRYANAVEREYQFSPGHSPLVAHIKALSAGQGITLRAIKLQHWKLPETLNIVFPALVAVLFLASVRQQVPVALEKSPPTPSR